MRAREFILENKVRPNIDIEWDGNFMVYAFIDGKRVGHAEFASDDPEGEEGFYAVSVGVNPEYRRMGVATAMYDAATEKFGEIIPSEHQTDDARAFWQSYGKEVVGEEIVTELRQSLDQYLKQQFPTWPDYVVRDLLYQQAKTIEDREQLDDWLQGIKYNFPVKQWRLQKLNITLDIFDMITQQQIIARKGGSANPYGVRKDAERHATQQAMIQKKGVSQEPIIVFDYGDGKLELVEGWHRTIQHLQAYPQGYQGPAWVGYI